mmetsp:Transcript_37427/g.81309  ORF Transcript_37427/g.81309 Transcript_37427/m.81309 type:complete len:415 (+) Transcript_37427:27-1271(+)|eukprot:CAMPEP_0206527346 /NCGR_PEP_ID=MMETSP0325_2-20121206/1294_1 /ASSEMBLY_ACC=CAM_ASM_000347 /TAXON_ID=2866 /ORGANISM="Crypthecodinium cohnii, Strain Seligo" /LENGTH=414 /DNA_ID=CAMNT_0054022739 /DNA_START=47 /DNA_END=1291 /DNA_ORIENTATION=+
MVHQGSVCVSSISCEMPSREQVLPDSPETPKTPLHVHQQWSMYRMYECEQTSRMKGSNDTKQRPSDNKIAPKVPEKAVENSSAREALVDLDENMPEELLDALDSRYASGALLQRYASTEVEMADMVQNKRFNSNRVLPADARQVCLKALEVCLGLTGLDPSKRFDAALLLDAHCAVVLGTSSVEDLVFDLPAITTAVATLIRKDATQKGYATLAALTRVGAKVAEWLETLGYHCDGTLTQEDVLRQEKLVLASVEWRLGSATAYSWINIFSQRFDVLTHGSYTQVVDWAKVSATAASSTLMVHFPAFQANGSCQPRQTGQGLWALYLVIAGLVPLDSLRPRDIDPAEWQALFLESQQKGELPQHVKMEDSVLNGLLYLLSSTCGSRLEVLQQDLLRTMEQMRAVVRTATLAARA